MTLPVDQIVDRAAGEHYILPFTLSAELMQRLLIINLQNDPDEVYEGFEPQVFDDPVNGKGLLVIGWRRDGRLDVYHQPGLTLTAGKYDMVRKGLSDLVERPMADARFEIGPQGVNLSISFDDKLGRPIVLRIHERSQKPRKPFALLAPFPGDTEKPPSLPLALLYDFYFVRRAGSEIEVSVAGRHHAPDKLPVPMDGAWMYFTRYSSDPYVLTWNEAHDGPLPVLRFGVGGEVEVEDVIYTLVKRAGQLELREMRPANAPHDVRITFEPSFPNVAALKDGALVEGGLTIWMEAAMGEITGVYSAQRTGGQVKLRLHPSGGWRPGVNKGATRIMFALVKVFRDWPRTYRWEAVIDLEGEGGPVMRSGWHRL